MATKLMAIVVAVGAAAPQARANSNDDAKSGGSADDQAAQPGQKANGEKSSDEGSSDFQKQDLNGHDLGTAKKENVFERDRFFVDKTDSAGTEKGTLIQGSFTSTTFGYRPPRCNTSNLMSRLLHASALSDRNSFRPLQRPVAAVAIESSEEPCVHSLS